MNTKLYAVRVTYKYSTFSNTFRQSTLMFSTVYKCKKQTATLSKHILYRIHWSSDSSIIVQFQKNLIFLILITLQTLKPTVLLRYESLKC